MEDYIDWYMNVYLEEELPWQWVSKRSYNIEHANISLFCFLDKCCWHCERKNQTGRGRSRRRSKKSSFKLFGTNRELIHHRIQNTTEWCINKNTLVLLVDFRSFLHLLWFLSIIRINTKINTQFYSFLLKTKNFVCNTRYTTAKRLGLLIDGLENTLPEIRFCFDDKKLYRT